MTKRLFSTALIILVAAGSFYAHTYLRPASNEKIYDSWKDRPLNASVFEKEGFFKGIEQVKMVNQTTAYRIAGGVIPHHLLPSHIIADFFSRLSYQQPKTIIIIGPNHFEKGNFPAITGTSGWQTPFGIIGTNEKIVNELVEDNFVKVDDSVIAADHAVSGLVPFIKYYTPDTVIVPILISRAMNQAEVMILAQKLSNYLDQDTVLVASVDFSHYLTSSKAQEKDKQTISLIRTFDFRKLMTLNDDNLDSPGSISVLLESMKLIGKTNLDILHHTNSGIIQKNSTAETTSYFSIAYY